MTESNVTRRGFLQGAGVAAAALATAGMLGGCSSNGDGGATKANEETNGGAASYSPDETMDVDIVVVGSGASGVAATVQAAELGATTLLLEKSDVTGGNGRLTEGMFAIGSQMQKELGVGDGVTFTDIIAAEQEFFNYRINNLLWKDLAGRLWREHRLDGVAWREVFRRGGRLPWLGQVRLLPLVRGRQRQQLHRPHARKRSKAGAVVMADTPALDLVVENGAVKGLYAEKPDGSILEVNAKAVILTSGGYAQNEETMAERGWDLTYSHNNGVNGHDGDGLRMATSAGAHDVSRERCFLREAYSFGIDFFADMSQTIHRGGPVLWVNQDAERYTNEGCGSFVPQCVGNAVHTQAESYLVMSKDVIDEFVSRTGYEGLQADMDEAAAQCPGDNVYKADTIKELAELQGLDAAVFEATVKRYNELCDKAVDEDFNKDAAELVPIKTAPFYIFRQDMAFWTSIGGIDTNRKMEVVTAKGEPIPGLYAAGTDGCNLYRETYTMSIPASCNANNCNSGRIAARSAYEACVK